MRRWQQAALALGVILLAFSLFNASWLAPGPKGKLILVAHRGVAQQLDRTRLGRDDCSAARIAVPEHPFIENTIPSIVAAGHMGADMVELDVQPTKDGRMVVFDDLTLDCRTDGHGPLRERSLAELKRLDVGYGYSADGGRTFPLRGRPNGRMPSVEEVLKAAPNLPLLFTFKSTDAREADLLVAAFNRAGTPLGKRYGFSGDEAIAARMHVLAPESWVWSRQRAEGCGREYLKWGWLGRIPASCRDGTIVVPLNHRWAAWGWPNRFLDRMARANARVILIGDMEDGASPAGLSDPEQLGRVPRDYRGYLGVEDIYTVGRALRN